MKSFLAEKNLIHPALGGNLSESIESTLTSEGGHPAGPPLPKRGRLRGVQRSTGKALDAAQTSLPRVGWPTTVPIETNSSWW